MHIRFDNVITMIATPLLPKILFPKYSGVDIWDDTLFNSIAEVDTSDILFVVENSFSGKIEPSIEASYEKLNINCYVKVLLSRGMVGWVHRDNCNECP